MNGNLMDRNGMLWFEGLNEQHLSIVLGSWTNWKVEQKSRTDGEQIYDKADKEVHDLNVWTSGIANTDSQN